MVVRGAAKGHAHHTRVVVHCDNQLASGLVNRQREAPPFEDRAAYDCRSAHRFENDKEQNEAGEDNGCIPR
jgi:hypothetical protein